MSDPVVSPTTSPPDWQLLFAGGEYSFEPLTQRARDWLSMYMAASAAPFLGGKLYVAAGAEQPLLRYIFMQGHAVAMCQPLPVDPRP